MIVTHQQRGVLAPCVSYMLYSVYALVEIIVSDGLE